MKKIVFSLFCLGALGFVYRASQSDPVRKGGHATLKARASRLAQTPPAPQSDRALRTHAAPAEAAAPEPAPVEAIASEKDFLRTLDEANLTQTITIAQTTQRLRAEDHERIAGYFSAALADLAQKDTDRRERLVYIANELQIEELLPFWKDLASRKIPRFEDEAKYLYFGEPTEEMQAIHLELLTSVRNIGIIAAHDEGASKFLADLVLHPSSPLHDDFIRERAYISLKEANLNAALRTLKGLAADDALRPRLMAP